jgi:uncharacterized protein (DUF1697 family)
MTAYAALLRAVNVGGTGKLAMTDLRACCAELGFANVATYIQSGNAVFTSRLGEAKVVAALEAALAKLVGKPVGVLVRTGAELAEIVTDHPFPEAPGNRLIVSFLPAPISAAEIAAIRIPGDERLAARGREVFVHYGDGMADSKLKLPFASRATARNLNTVAKLAALTAAL